MSQDDLGAVITRNVGDLEQAIAHVQEKMDPSINSAAWEALERAFKGHDFHFDEGDDPDASWFAPRSWLVEGDSDPWFELSVRNRDELKTWLASYCDPRSEKEAIGIQWYYDNLYVRDYKAILEEHAEDLKAIELAGFRRDGNDIYLPIEFNQEAIAEGFAQGNLKDAMEPISVAAKVLVDTLPHFQKLRDAIVAKANG